MLRLVLAHLLNVAAASSKNLMSVCNLAVCWGPTLLRPERETVASILELKFYNVLVESLLNHFAEIFDPVPPRATPSPVPISSRTDISSSGVGLVAGAACGNYAAPHHQLLQQFAGPPLAGVAHRGPSARCSSSSESVSSA
ncbi:unnamed protein product, partial [Leptidea sinapis]